MLVSLSFLTKLEFRAFLWILCLPDYNENVLIFSHRHPIILSIGDLAALVSSVSEVYILTSRDHSLLVFLPSCPEAWGHFRSGLRQFHGSTQFLSFRNYSLDVQCLKSIISYILSGFFVALGKRVNFILVTPPWLDVEGHFLNFRGPLLSLAQTPLHFDEVPLEHFPISHFCLKIYPDVLIDQNQI